MKKTFDDFAKEINIAEVLDSFGYILDKPGSAKNINSGWLVYNKKNADHATVETLLVKRNNDSTSRYQGQYFYLNANDNTDKGNVIHFLCSRKGWHMKTNAKEINDFLNAFQGNYVPSDKSYTQPLKPVSEEARNKTVLRYYQLSPLADLTYLNSRGISESVCKDKNFIGKIFHNTVVHTEHRLNGKKLTPEEVENCLAKGIKTETKDFEFKNTVFPMTTEDGQVVGLEMKNSNFHGNAPDSAKSSSLWISNIDKSRPVDLIVVNESAVDAISHYQLNEDRLKEKNVVYVSTGGNLADGQIVLIEKLCLHLEPKQIFLANDNDVSGIKFNINIMGKTNLLGSNSTSFELNKEGAYNYKCLVRGSDESGLNKTFDYLKKEFAGEASVSLSKNTGVIEILAPNNVVVLSRLEAEMLKVKSLSNFVKIEKPISKDFNDDLKVKLSIPVQVKTTSQAKEQNNLKM